MKEYIYIYVFSPVNQARDLPEYNVSRFNYELLRSYLSNVLNIYAQFFITARRRTLFPSMQGVLIIFLLKRI